MPRSVRPSHRLRSLWCAALAALGILGAGAVGEAGASITGVCPDGSIFIVQSAEAIPCAEAKRVEPEEVPPLKAGHLPRPYQWEIFNRQNDPNNPYNLIDSARQVRRARDDLASEPTTPPVGAGPPPQPAPPPQQAVQRRSAGSSPSSIDLGLSDESLRDLELIVELSQQHAPAAFLRGGAATPSLAVRLARSVAFGARLRDAWAAQGRSLAGAVVLFSAAAEGDEAFHGNFTFSQGHMAFHPDHADPSQFGVIRGQLGLLGAGDSVLGYVVLPEHFALDEPLDVYWNDRRLTARLRP
jgi:hypothetical protein